MSLFKSSLPAGFLFPYRHPKAKGLVEGTLYGLGSLFRGVGAALDELGSMVQGPQGSVKDHVQPNLAFAPVHRKPDVPVNAGQVVPAPPAAARTLKIKEVVVPNKHSTAFVAANANVLGNVKLGAGSSVWYGAVLRGDVNGIEVGANSNIQDNAIVHVSKYSMDGTARPTVIGNNVTIGHAATVHACTIEDNCLVGMGATVLDGATVKSGSIVAAGAVVPPNTTIPSGQVWAGSPAKFLRHLEPEEASFIGKSASCYAELSAIHKFEQSKTFEEQYTESCIIKDRAALADPSNSVHQMWEYDSQTALVARAKR
ncbi:hypothetical protein CHLRE_09g415850v5 [Chlamydomonas reinhardtii]|uniref:Mitochondrial NADH:ubiquinone oxidoreductase 32 kDa subunit n=1 Tax=Chlamydomonas reinhardtii TaxID=3055 RepID=Q6S7R7_CHLRE|nr:uncharacterized protein CHLRE_09g415850v5 [Chlamydomonas reinhardtii]AAR82949.1 putative gamma carbonic anhydrase [Chlamydomonas reinhardtii]AAR82950.1 putative gamma carbonic anhydrase [Chlamydomonas reinhardtii]AAS48197.1 mitochondrial NADH:ubiquinone oxidoreductase 32 kDa subunit [Chlamydomonas reinhardtii]PNW79458.1 hypothetical protein CHLRE_09g415850v5 [Chlamydomonas reinhardtii]|eukprot:XP_001696746.1 gamma carbonic anhydrase [Chlamydomonas reinhardtii]